MKDDFWEMGDLTPLRLREMCCVRIDRKSSLDSIQVCKTFRNNKHETSDQQATADASGSHGGTETPATFALLESHSQAPRAANAAQMP